MPANWFEILVSWLPFIALIVVWLFLSKAMRMGKYYEEMRRMNALLDRIAAALEKRAGTSA